MDANLKYGLAEGTADAKATPLDGLDSHACTAGRIGDLIESFIARFRGEGRAGENAALTPVPSGHAGQLHRLESNLARAEELARELRSIG